MKTLSTKKLNALFFVGLAFGLNTFTVFAEAKNIDEIQITGRSLKQRRITKQSL
tara:strand:- start:344 stop:505 length:162 start_codon:yes stop_codon:yes gene_type:complete